MYHDVAATQRRALDRTASFFGTVCRMSELQGAVAGVQLTRMDAIIACCRENRGRIIARIAAIAAERGFLLRRCYDEGGDTAIALVLLCPSATTARTMAARLQPSGVPAKVLFEPRREDFHVACHWAPVLAQRSWSSDTPWARSGGDVVYGPDAWSRTIDVLGRALHIDVHPDLDDRLVDHLAGALEAAIEAS
jgi:dTDP-4-amino-4,6-dideoxygalactose transaminase